MSKKNWKNLEDLLTKDYLDDEIVGDLKPEKSKRKDSNEPFDSILTMDDENVKNALNKTEQLKDNFNKDSRYNRLASLQEDPEFSGMLKIYADEGSAMDDEGKRYNVFCSNQNVVEIVEKMIARLGLEDKCWEIIKNTCGFGDEYYEIIYSKDMKRVLKLLKLPRNLLERVEINGELKHFKVRKNIGSNPNSFEYEYQNFIKNLKKEETTIAPYRVLHWKNDSDKYYPHGESIFEGMLSAIEEYRLMKQAMMVSRITRAAERRIYRINVGQLQGEKGIEYARKIIDGFKNRKIINRIDANRTDKERNFISSGEDIVIPYRQGDEAHTVDTLPALTATPIEDIEFMRDRIYPGVGIPRSYFYDDTFANANMNLSNKDIKFARRIQRVQKFHLIPIYKLAIIELKLHKIKKSDYEDLVITLNNPSTLLEQQRIEVQTAKWNLIQTIRQTNAETVFVNDMFIYETVMGMSKEEILQFMLLNKAQESKKNLFYYLPIQERPDGYDLLDEFYDQSSVEGGGETPEDMGDQGDVEGALDNAGLTPEAPEEGGDEETPTETPDEGGEEPIEASYQDEMKKKKLYIEQQKKKALKLKQHWIEMQDRTKKYDVVQDKKKKYTKATYSIELIESSEELRGLKKAITVYEESETRTRKTKTT